MFDEYIRGCVALDVGEILDRELVRRTGLHKHKHGQEPSKVSLAE